MRTIKWIFLLLAIVIVVAVVMIWGDMEIIRYSGNSSERRNREELFHHITFFSSNLLKTQEFYERIGFHVIVTPTEMRKGMGFDGLWMNYVNSFDKSENRIHFLFFENDDSLMTLSRPTSRIGVEHYCIELGDTMDDVVATCRSNGVPLIVGAVRPLDNAQQMFITDFDGNTLEFYQRNHPRELNEVHSVLDHLERRLRMYQQQRTKLRERQKNNHFGEGIHYKSIKNGTLRLQNHGKLSVAASFGNPLATETAHKILRKGGSAIDAFIAGNIVMGVLEPMNCGLGGDLFAMIYDPVQNKTRGINGSGRRLLQMNTNLIDKQTKKMSYRNAQARIPIHGPMSFINVPGVVQAWYDLHKEYGKLEWKALFSDGIKYAMKGFEMSFHSRLNWEHVWRIKQSFENHEITNVQSVYDFIDVYIPGQIGPLVGESYRNPILGKTLINLARYGAKEFYNGTIAQEICESVQKSEGYINLSDLEKHHETGSEWIETPLNFTYRNEYTIHTTTKNSQAIAALQMLSVLNLYSAVELREDRIKRLYVMIALKRLVYICERSVYGGDWDLHFHPNTLGGYDTAYVKTFIDQHYAQRVPIPTTFFSRCSFRQSKQSNSPPASNSIPLPHRDTVGIVVSDATGLTITGLQSLGSAFGSMIVSPKLGFVMQDRGCKYNLLSPDVHPNSLDNVNSRPFHTLSPYIVTKKHWKNEDGNDFYMAISVKGGDRQPFAFVYILSNLIDCRMTLQEAVDYGRFRHMDSKDPSPTDPLNTRYESEEIITVEREPSYALSSAEIRRLIALGIAITTYEVDKNFEDSGYGIAQVIIRQEQRDSYSNQYYKTIDAITDRTRKPGLAIVE